MSYISIHSNAAINIFHNLVHQYYFHHPDKLTGSFQLSSIQFLSFLFFFSLGRHFIALRVYKIKGVLFRELFFLNIGVVASIIWKGNIRVGFLRRQSTGKNDANLTFTATIATSRRAARRELRLIDIHIDKGKDRWTSNDFIGNPVLWRKRTANFASVKSIRRLSSTFYSIFYPTLFPRV